MYDPNEAIPKPAGLPEAGPQHELAKRDDPGITAADTEKFSLNS